MVDTAVSTIGLGYVVFAVSMAGVSWPAVSGGAETSAPSMIEAPAQLGGNRAVNATKIGVIRFGEAYD